MAKVFLTTPGAGTWTVPDDCQEATIECIGGGGNGAINPSQLSRSEGGGGGAYAKKNSLLLTPGESIDYQVGGISQDTWFKSISDVLAKGGASHVSGSSSPGLGGNAALCVGDVKYSGGNGFNTDSSNYAGGGGGAAGPNGNGLTPSNTNRGGNADNNNGGIGGFETTPATSGTQFDLTHGCGGGGAAGVLGSYDNRGALYGGGGGAMSYGQSNVYQESGAKGLIVITYTPVATGSSKFFQLF